MRATRNIVLALHSSSLSPPCSISGRDASTAVVVTSLHFVDAAVNNICVFGHAVFAVDSTVGQAVDVTANGFASSLWDVTGCCDI